MLKKIAAAGFAATLALVAVPAGAVAAGGAKFRVGAAVQSFTPPVAGAIPADPADCVSAADAAFNGPRQYGFEEPYVDQQHSGHYDLGETEIRGVGFTVKK